MSAKDTDVFLDFEGIEELIDKLYSLFNTIMRSRYYSFEFSESCPIFEKDIDDLSEKIKACESAKQELWSLKEYFYTVLKISYFAGMLTACNYCKNKVQLPLFEQLKEQAESIGDELYDLDECFLIITYGNGCQYPQESFKLIQNDFDGYWKMFHLRFCDDYNLDNYFPFCVSDVQRALFKIGFEFGRLFYLSNRKIG